MTYADGFRARLTGATIGDCPWAPGDPDGADWRRGWIDMETSRRSALGTFGATAEERDLARRQTMAAGGYGPDPTAILDEPAPVALADLADVVAVVTDWARQIGEAFAAFADQMRAFVESDIGAEDPKIPGPPLFTCHRHGPQPTFGYCRPCHDRSLHAAHDQVNVRAQPRRPTRRGAWNPHR